MTCILIKDYNKQEYIILSVVYSESSINQPFGVKVFITSSEFVSVHNNILHKQNFLHNNNSSHYPRLSPA